MTRKDGKEVVIPEELFDLSSDPGERENLAHARPEIAAEMRAKLDAERARTPDDPPAAPGAAHSQGAVLALRFVGAGRPRRVSGWVSAGEPGQSVTVGALPVGVEPSAVNVAGQRVQIAFNTSPEAPVGFDLVIDPPATNVAWEFSLDGEPWPASRVFGGPFGLAAPALRGGANTDEAREVAEAPAPPLIVADVDEGLFITRMGGSKAPTSGRSSAAGTAEMKQLLRDWGYAHGRSSK